MQYRGRSGTAFGSARSRYVTRQLECETGKDYDALHRALLALEAELTVRFRVRRDSTMYGPLGLSFHHQHGVARTFHLDFQELLAAAPVQDPPFVAELSPIIGCLEWSITHVE